jgi:hypothetical protein
MKKRRAAIVILVFLIAGHSLQAQYYYYYNDKYYEKALVIETGVSAGIINALTDLGGKKGAAKNFTRDINWNNSKPCFSVYVTGMYKYALGIKLETSIGTVHSADSMLKPVAASTFGRYERNLSFKSRIRELQLSFEIYPLFFREYREFESPLLSPYLLAGIGYFSFKPTALLNGYWHSLQPLHTEGQGSALYPGRLPYKLNQFNVPIGFGLRYEMGPLFSARLELVHRFLFTDYLDDVSKDYVSPELFAFLTPQQAAIARQLADRQPELNPNHLTQPGAQRGDPSHNDAYFSILLKFGISLRRPAR